MSSALPAGYRLDTYEVCRELGRGGFGITYLARDRSLDAEVALKEYFPAGCASRRDDQTVASSSASHDLFEWGFRCFLDEARTLHKVRHPNVVDLQRYFRANGTAYLVLEHIEGNSLDTILKSHGRLSPAVWQWWLDRLLDGLEHVHARNYLHRDITPRNILVRRTDNSPVLIDFGAARIAVGERTRTVVLTEAYAPIEQHSARARQGPFTDIYALAAVSYRALTGDEPSSAPARMLEGDRLALEAMGPSDYASWLNAIGRGMEIQPTDRPQSVAEWRDDLAGAWRECRVHPPTERSQGHSPRSERPGTHGPAPRGSQDDEFHTSTSASKGQRWIAALPWILALAAVAGTALMVGHYVPPNDEPSPHPSILAAETALRAAAPDEFRDFVEAQSVTLEGDDREATARLWEAAPVEFEAYLVAEFTASPDDPMARLWGAAPAEFIEYWANSMKFELTEAAVRAAAPVEFRAAEAWEAEMSARLREVPGGAELTAELMGMSPSAAGDLLGELTPDLARDGVRGRELESRLQEAAPAEYAAMSAAWDEWKAAMVRLREAAPTEYETAMRETWTP